MFARTSLLVITNGTMVLVSSYLFGCSSSAGLLSTTLFTPGFGSSALPVLSFIPLDLTQLITILTFSKMGIKLGKKHLTTNIKKILFLNTLNTLSFLCRFYTVIILNLSVLHLWVLPTHSILSKFILKFFKTTVLCPRPFTVRSCTQLSPWHLYSPIVKLGVCCKVGKYYMCLHCGFVLACSKLLDNVIYFSSGNRLSTGACMNWRLLWIEPT